MSLAGKVSLITGGAQGLGKKFGESLLQKGAKVCVADINQTKGETTVKDFTERFGHGRALFVKCDVTSEKDFEHAFKRAKSEYGRIDIVCNNAGIGDETRWRQTIDVNLVGVMQGTILGIKYMRKDNGGEGGLIVNIASTAGLIPVDFMPAYVASKTGVVAYTRSWAENSLNRKTGIRFCALCPSFADTISSNCPIPKVSTLLDLRWPLKWLV
ncbi:15-hydroxyprostaglandin dehydrogenase [NAD(+)]-like [Liolophura sinensis]|uniref:15-hydroxyprostaglandin dehydrogenase [NAD(+)]-like n=1 Tax=Liolophura sinensis TaxID=3198878 RepID=UPI003159423B